MTSRITKEPSTMPTTAMSKYPLLAAIGVTALSLAACGSSTSGSPTSSSSASGSPSPSAPSTSTSAPSTSTPTARGRDHVGGLIASVSPMTIQVTQQSGTATVAYSPTTTVSEVTAAQLSDVTAGSCVLVRPATGPAQTGGTVTARMVSINAAGNGQCQPPRGRAVGGTVSSVNGNTIVLNGTGSNGNTSQTTVQVDNTTTYAKRALANSQAITQGKCITARGTDDSSGTLQATTINLRPATNGTCPQPNGGHHHGG
jgi:Domain of unknown function (DUF5666)